MPAPIISIQNAFLHFHQHKFAKYKNFHNNSTHTNIIKFFFFKNPSRQSKSNPPLCSSSKTDTISCCIPQRQKKAFVLAEAQTTLVKSLRAKYNGFHEGVYARVPLARGAHPITLYNSSVDDRKFGKVFFENFCLGHKTGRQ